MGVTGAEANAKIKAREVDVKEPLLFKKAFREILASLLLPELADKRFHYKLQYKQKLKTILIAEVGFQN